LKYWVWLASKEGVGLVTKHNLLKAMGTPYNIFNARRSDYFAVERVNDDIIAQLMDKSLAVVDEILERCIKTNCRIITMEDSEYPDRLRNIYDPPLVIYVKGNMPHVDTLPVVGIVGTRRCTAYGMNATEKISRELSERGIVISTGLAKGIDTAASIGALRGGTPMIGVIGTGTDIVFPYENRQLFENVASKGAIISEYYPGVKGHSHHFPARNRIISGLSCGVAVIEAPDRSGALITATRALEQGRDVFALPGNIDAPCCVGSNRLLKEGAIPFTSADDIIDEYIELFSDILQGQTGVVTSDYKQKRTKSNNNVIDNKETVDYIGLDKIIGKLDGVEKTVAQIIGCQTLHIDEIIVNSGLEAKNVLTTLTMMEIDGYVQSSNSKYYSLSNH